MKLLIRLEEIFMNKNSVSAIETTERQQKSVEISEAIEGLDVVTTELRRLIGRMGIPPEASPEKENTREPMKLVELLNEGSSRILRKKEEALGLISEINNILF